MTQKLPFKEPGPAHKRRNNTGRLKFLLALFALLGKWSFEIFLVHLLLFGYMNELGVEMRGNLAWLAAIAVSVVLSVGYGKAIEHVRKRKQ